MSKMIIGNFRTVEMGECIKASVTIESNNYGEAELWFSMPKKYNNYICRNQLDGFLVGMLYPAMRYGDDIYVDGCVSEKLLFNLNNYAIPLLLGFSDSLKKIRISSKETLSENYEGAGVGAGFSAGVDSFCTLYDRYVLEDSSSYKVNSLLFFNVGSHGDWLQHGSPEFTRDKFTTRYIELKKFTDEINLDFINIDSNLHFFHHWWHSYSHTLRAVSVVLLLQQHYSKYYYSSAGLNYAGTLNYSKYYRNRDIGAYCDPILLPLLSTESLDFISDGCAYTRSEKVLHIIDYEPAGRYLNVCIDHVDKWENCSACDKCLRTLLTLDVTGNLDKFDKIFDVNIYREKRDSYITSQMQKVDSDPFAAENINLAKSLGVRLPSVKYVRFLRRLRDISKFPIFIYRKLLGTI